MIWFSLVLEYDLSLQQYRAMGNNFTHVTRDKVPQLMSVARKREIGVNVDTPTDFLVTTYSLFHEVGYSNVDSIFITIPHDGFFPKFRQLLSQIDSFISTGEVPRIIIYVPVREGADPLVTVSSIVTTTLKSPFHVVVV